MYSMGLSHKQEIDKILHNIAQYFNKGIQFQKKKQGFQ